MPQVTARTGVRARPAVEYPDDEQTLLLTVPESARELRVAPSTCWELVRSGELPSIVIGERMRRVRRVDLVEYVNGRVEARAS